MPPLNLDGVIDFTKYTLAVAAACFVYTLQTLVPQQQPAMRYVVFALLLVLFLASFCGVFVFAVATNAKHGSQRGTHARFISSLGIGHLALLFVGMVWLGVMLGIRVLQPPSPPSPMVVHCTPPPAAQAQP
jgi:uncharacterized BrkB/YihY/UPF0761 family membrane protein